MLQPPRIPRSSTKIKKPSSPFCCFWSLRRPTSGANPELVHLLSSKKFSRNSLFFGVSWDPLHPTSISSGAFIETLGRWWPERAEPTPLLVVRMRENPSFGHRTTGHRPQLLSVTPNLLPPLGEPVS
ncbi:hypothetical protein AXF42_Ash020888 [Apostasia shenzhenica]|uniref:Uncharacterized protein n=1 Tax=Apostasia shenzhenica TaxID=1088818 RepID=A0A2I0AD75_9ASPA|nr:hypothetical protein AXF42_Ash020888 [Apostasia shenzhenica]